jgi:hypothetical protein
VHQDIIVLVGLDGLMNSLAMQASIQIELILLMPHNVKYAHPSMHVIKVQILWLSQRFPVLKVIIAQLEPDIQPSILAIKVHIRQTQTITKKRNVRCAHQVNTVSQRD